MGFLEWFVPPPTRPILLRLDLGGAPCPAFVDIEAQWFPLGERVESTLISASSMLLLPWRANADRVSLIVRAGGHRAHALVTRASNCDGGVLDLKLVSVTDA